MSVSDKSEMHIAEAVALLTLLRNVAEEADETRWLELRETMISSLWTTLDSLNEAIDELP
ncbi:hypothetical protein [Oricola cellulosilytica]|uniref:Uncharacterized protein n=1 Tax=Oricola cellulosilytica TaxID=1429082 RepID=A0A4V2MNY0_9HYPH|nr:hypothetical protein [Oricola cellulosilytica]TCD15177.1 hypothetical protein E0D97_06405 [Oricola cellulosilytica]